MWTLSQMIGMGILSILSVIDIQFRRIPAEILGMANAAAILYQLIFRREELWLLIGGAAVGIAFLLFSRVTRERMGYGDSWAILILGIFLGLWGLLEVLAAAFFLLAAVSIVLLARKKMSKSCAVPFYPFLTIGYMISVWGGGYV